MPFSGPHAFFRGSPGQFSSFSGPHAFFRGSPGQFSSFPGPPTVSGPVLAASYDGGSAVLTSPPRMLVSVGGGLPFRQCRVRSGMPEGVGPGVLNGQSGVYFKDLVDILIIVTFAV